MPRRYLYVPRWDEPLAKRLGPKWDARRAHWYVPKNIDTEPFSKWFRTLWLTLKQRHYADQLCNLYGFQIPYSVRYQKTFGKRFLDLFGYDPKNIFYPTGVRRVAIISYYIREDEYIDHLLTKFDISRDQTCEENREEEFLL